MKRNLTTLIIGALLVLVFALLLFTFRVRITQVAIVTTFSKPTREITEPNLYFKWPWPIQQVYLFDKRVQNFEDKYTESLTADQFGLITMTYVGWRITQPREFFQKFPGGSVSEAEKNLEGILRSAKLAVVGKHPLSDFVTAESGGPKLDQIEGEILADVQSRLSTNNYGLQVEFLGLKKVGLPESVTQSVFDRMKSERKKLADKSESEGEAEAVKIKSGADREAAEMVANANAEATRIIGLGEAAAAQSSLIFQQDPQLAVFLLRLKALEASLQERSTLIFDQSKPPFDVLNGVSTNLVK